MTSNSTCDDTGLTTGTSYLYRVIGVWRSWSATSANSSAVEVLVFSKFSLNPSTSGPTAGVGFTVSITAQDSGGNTITRYAGTQCLTFSGPASSPNSTAPSYPAAGSCASGSAVTFANGVATSANAASITLYDAQSVSLTATDNPSGNNGSTGLTVKPATPNKLGYNPEPPTSGTAGSAVTSFGVSVEDLYGNIETTGNHGSTDAITLSIASGPSGGVFNSGSSTYNVSASNGTATFSGIVLDTAGSYSLKATDTQGGESGVVTATSSPTTTINPTTPNKVAYDPEPPTSGTAGSALTSFAVAIEDQYGNIETTGSSGATDTVSLSIASGPSGGAFNSASTTYTNVPASNGLATFPGIVLDTAGAYTFTATDTSRSVATTTSTPATAVSAATANKLAFTQQPGGTITGGSAFPTQPKVAVEDQFNNVVTTDSSTVSLSITPGTPSSGGPGTLSGCTGVEASGVVSFSGCSVNTAGTNYKLHATDGSLVATDSGAFNVSVGAASQFLVSPSSSTPSAGTAFTVTLTAEDAGGNTVTTYSGSHTITWSGATTSPAGNAPSYPTGSVSFTAGVSTTTLNATLFAAGANILTASASSPTVTGSASPTVSAVTASHLAWTSATLGGLSANSPPGTCDLTCTSGANNVVFKAKVSLTDLYGNPVVNTGGAITVTVTHSGGTLTGTQVTIANGRAESSGGGDGSVAGEITFQADSGHYTDTLSAADGTHTAASATFSH
jgi:hypothetical protein